MSAFSKDFLLLIRREECVHLLRFYWKHSGLFIMKTLEHFTAVGFMEAICWDSMIKYAQAACFLKLHVTVGQSRWKCSKFGPYYCVRSRSGLWVKGNVLSNRRPGERTQRKKALSCRRMKYLFDTRDAHCCCRSTVTWLRNKTNHHCATRGYE